MTRRTTFLKVMQDEYPSISAAWAAHPRMKKEVADQVLFGSDGSSRESELHSVALARYDFKEDLLSEPKHQLSFEEGGSPPRIIAVQPKGDAVIISFDSGCKLYTWEAPSLPETRFAKQVELKLQPCDEVLPELDDAGPQNCLQFSDDGTLLASGGEDGHIRVFRWPSMSVIINAPKALNSVKDLDISLDSGFLSATGDNTPCLVWDLKTAELVATIEPAKGERLSLSRFSRHEKRAFLFITLTKEKKGFIGVWDMTSWKRIGAKRFIAEPITSCAISHHGRRLAIGTNSGDISLVEIDKMKVQQTIKNAHSESVTALEFSPNDKVLLSLSSDCSSRVSALDLSRDWKDWQIYLVLLGMFLTSVLLFYLLYAYGDTFFRVPKGRAEYERQGMQAEWAGRQQVRDEYINYGSHEEF